MPGDAVRPPLQGATIPVYRNAGKIPTWESFNLHENPVKPL